MRKRGHPDSHRGPRSLGPSVLELTARARGCSLRPRGEDGQRTAHDEPHHCSHGPGGPGVANQEAYQQPEHPAYPEDWYRRIVKERGEVLKVKKVPGLAPDEE